LAARLLAGVPLVVPTPIAERELFAQLGADYVRAADIPAPAMASEPARPPNTSSRRILERCAGFLIP
jgi:hypothetical protein